jgi:2-polyprenyl-3-methyl-5-hydroxy-6-metoxy-1,4-benzoquinol methylase
MEARLFISSEDRREGGKGIAPLIGDLSPACIISGEEVFYKKPVPLQEAGHPKDSRRPWDFVVLDRFKTSRKELDRWASLGPIIGIDEGGPARDRFDFLLDILPGLPGRSPANLTAPALIPLPMTRREEPASFDPPPVPIKILVTFGAEDPAGLTLPVCRVLTEGAGDSPEPPVLVTAVAGSLAFSLAESQKGNPPPSGGPAGPVQGNVRFLEALPNLKEKLASYDLVITHFGLTAFEALHAGTPALLLSPTAYHEKLARHAGFVSAGIRQKGVRRLRRYIYRSRQKGQSPGKAEETLNRPELKALAARSAAAAKKYGLDAAAPRSLGSLFAGFSPSLAPVCPACGCGNRQEHPVLARFNERTYRRCPRCGMVYMLRLTESPVEYAEDYFFGFYRRQYGKTYLEDFPNLKQAGKTRLHRIRHLLPVKSAVPPRLLDIGCAYGPFLVAAAEGGFSPLGMDPAEEAVRYVSDRLKIPAIRGFFPDPARRELRKDAAFDAVTLWYVLEHFGDAAGTLREIHRLLKPGGVLAFSTPSISGVSGRKSLKRFLEKSPGDHFTLWNPRRLAGVLGPCGFRVKKVIVTGHHPERFPLIGKRLKEKRGPVYRAVEGISRLLGLGDTFEAYAVKK